MSTPRVSICLPNLNTRPFLEERMETLLAQTFTDWELIISDNYSDDGSWEFLQKFKRDPRVRLSQAPRAGMYANWNQCLRQARGEFIYIATSDDTARPDLLASLLRPLERRPDLQLAMCDFEAIDEQSKPLARPLQTGQTALYGEWMQTPSIRSGKTEFLVHACIGLTWVTMTSVLFRRGLLKQVGEFVTDVGSIGDYEWGLRASLASDIAFVPGRLATWRVRDGQGTPQQMTRQFCCGMLALLNRVLRDPHSNLPAQWRTVDRWDDEITAAWRALYLSSFNLWRRAAIRRPSAFLAGMWNALCEEPGLLGRQALRGFAWSEKFDVDRMARARRLMELFRADWPPKPMKEVVHPWSEQ